MSLSMAMPVWATSTGLAAGVRDGSGNEATVNFKSLKDGKDDTGVNSTDYGDFNHLEHSKSTGTNYTDDDTVYVTLNVDTEFKVSIPKKIVLGKTTGVVSKATKSENQSIVVKDVNLGDYQQLQIYAPEIIKVYDKNGETGETKAHNREVKVIWGSLSNSDIFTSYTDTSSESPIANKGIMTLDQSSNDLPTAGIHFSKEKRESFIVAPNKGNDIYAGHWVGVLPFTVKVTGEPDTNENILDQVPTTPAPDGQ